LHLVWATLRRSPFLSDPVDERRVHRCIQAEAEKLGCVVLAVDGMPDHVHLVVKVPTKLSAAKLAQTVKGCSSNFANEQLQLDEHFNWQEHYGAFSVSLRDLERVVRYVQSQKEHHATGDLWPALEEVDESDEPDDDTHGPGH
jgi:putative transposase